MAASKPTPPAFHPPSTRLGCLFLLILGLLVAVLVLISVAVVKRGLTPIAKRACKDLEEAFMSYHREYRRFPVEGIEEGSDARIDSADDAVEVLMAVSERDVVLRLNPRQILFYSGDVNGCPRRERLLSATV